MTTPAAETPATPAATETPAAKEEPKPAAAAAAKVEASKAADKAAPAAKEEAAKEESTKAFTLGEEDDDVPEETAAKLLQLTPTALNKRLARHTKRELIDAFGTADTGEIKTKLEKLAEFEAKAEETRLASLSEKERLTEEAKKEKERADKAEKAYAKAVDAQTFATYDATAEKVIAKFFKDDDDTKEFVTDRLKKHVLSLDDADLKNPGKVFEAWAEKYAKSHPMHAKAAAEEAKKEAKKEEKKEDVKTIALTTGANPNRPEKSPIDMAKKTARPGQPNSMTKAEYADWKRQRSLS